MVMYAPATLDTVAEYMVFTTSRSPVPVEDVTPFKIPA